MAISKFLLTADEAETLLAKVGQSKRNIVHPEYLVLHMLGL